MSFPMKSHIVLVRSSNKMLPLKTNVGNTNIKSSKPHPDPLIRKIIYTVHSDYVHQR